MFAASALRTDRSILLDLAEQRLFVECPGEIKIDSSAFQIYSDGLESARELLLCADTIWGIGGLDDLLRYGEAPSLHLRALIAFASVLKYLSVSSQDAGGSDSCPELFQKVVSSVLEENEGGSLSIGTCTTSPRMSGELQAGLETGLSIAAGFAGGWVRDPTVHVDFSRRVLSEMFGPLPLRRLADVVLSRPVDPKPTNLSAEEEKRKTRCCMGADFICYTEQTSKNHRGLSFPGMSAVCLSKNQKAWTEWIEGLDSP